MGMDRGSDGQTGGYSFCRPHTVGMRLTAHHMLETTRQQCEESSLELTVCRRTLQLVWHALRMDEDRGRILIAH
eukprot:364326-Chlamydomonas_euryale.AAC.16